MDVEALAQMRGHNLTEQIPRSRDLWYQVPGADQCKPRLHTVTVPCNVQAQRSYQYHVQTPIRSNVSVQSPVSTGLTGKARRVVHVSSPSSSSPSSPQTKTQSTSPESDRSSPIPSMDNLSVSKPVSATHSSPSSTSTRQYYESTSNDRSYEQAAEEVIVHQRPVTAPIQYTSSGRPVTGVIRTPSRRPTTAASSRANLHDPVSRHAQWNSAWKNDQYLKNSKKRPKENIVERQRAETQPHITPKTKPAVPSNYVPPPDRRRDDLRWGIRANLYLNDESYQPPSKPVAPRNSYVPPTDKRRDQLRWNIRQDLVYGDVPDY